MTNSSAKIKIGLDAHAASGRLSGLGVYVKHLVFELKALAPAHFDLCFYSRDPSEKDMNTLSRLRWENCGLPKQAARDRVELLHVPAFAPPLCRKTRVVATVHDLIGMLYPNQRGKASAFYWGKYLPFAVKRADFLIADSQYTKNDLLQHLRVPEKKIRVIYPGAAQNFSAEIPATEQQALKQRLSIRARYFLFVGTLEPRKNLRGALEAFRLFLKESADAKDFQFVIVGSKDFAHGQFFRELSQSLSFAEGQVLFTGYIDHQDLNALYAGAAAFVFPSLYEGFGFPVLEAMSAGTPVIASNRTSVPEVAGDAALLVNPESDHEICEAMKRLAGNDGLCRELVQKGLRQAKHFSWRRAAEETLLVYEKVLEGSAA